MRVENAGLTSVEYRAGKTDVATQWLLECLWPSQYQHLIVLAANRTYHWGEIALVETQINVKWR